MHLVFIVIVMSITVPVLVGLSLQVAMEMVFVPLQGADLSRPDPYHAWE